MKPDFEFERDTLIQETKETFKGLLEDDVWLTAWTLNHRCSDFYEEEKISYNQLRYLKGILINIQKKGAPNFESMNSKIIKMYDMLESQCLIDHQEFKEEKQNETKT